MKKISIMLISALVAVSAQATTITFDEPGHTHGGNVGGINGWVESYGVRTFNTLDVGGRGNVVWPDGGKAYKDVSGDMANITTISFLFQSYNAQISDFALTVGGVDFSNGEEEDAVMWLWIDPTDEPTGTNDHNLVVNSGSTGSVAFDYVRGRPYRFTAVLDFSQQKIISVTLEDLTGSLGTQTGSNVDFYTAKTLAEAQASTSILLSGYPSGRIGFDNITVESSVQVDFEEPLYVATVTSSSVAGQNGWLVFSGEGNVISNTPSVLQSGNQELGVRKDSFVYKHFSGANFVDNHTLKFKVGRTGEVNANIRLGDGSGNGSTIVHLLLSFSSGFYAYDGATSYPNVFAEFDANDVYEVTVDVDFGMSEYDVVVSNLTDGTSGSLAGLAFENAIAADQFTDNATLRFDPTYDTLWVDDIELNGQLDDFEEPVFYTEATTSFTDVGGQDDWVVFSGQAYVYSNSPAILGSGDQELGVVSGGFVYRNSVGSMLDTNTTCIFKVGRTAAMTGQMRLGVGGSDSNAIVHIDFDSASGIGVYDGGTGYVNVWSEFDANDVYRVKTEIDFATQTYDITINNLTDSTSASLAAVDFEHAKTLADFAADYATLRFEAQTSTLWVDDVLLYGPSSRTDSDGDDLPNFWELDYYGHITDNVTSNDIVANAINTALEAYIAGFIPIDSGAYFGFTNVGKSGDDIVLQWEGVAGRVYRVNWSPNLALGSFFLLDEDIVGGSYTDAVPAITEKFYKLEVELAP